MVVNHLRVILVISRRIGWARSRHWIVDRAIVTTGFKEHKGLDQVVEDVFISIKDWI
jgi:hypothetical protein